MNIENYGDSDPFFLNGFGEYINSTTLVIKAYIFKRQEAEVQKGTCNDQTVVSPKANNTPH